MPFCIDDDLGLENDLEMVVKFEEMVIDLDIFGTILEDIIMNMPLKDMTNLDCLMSTIPAPDIDSTMYVDTLSLVASKIRLDMNCFECKTPGVEFLALLLGAAGAFIDFSDAINGLVKSVTDAVSEGSLQGEIDRYLSSAPGQCPSSQYFGIIDDAPNASITRSASSLVPESDNFFRNFAIFLGGLCIIVAAAVAAAVAHILRGKKQRLDQLTGKSSLVESFKMKQTVNKMREEKLNTKTSSMFTSSTIPLFVRVSVPVVILGNIALFLSGHLSLGAKVDAKFDLVGTSLAIEEVFDFTLLGSSESINAKCKYILNVFQRMQTPN